MKGNDGFIELVAQTNTNEKDHRCVTYCTLPQLYHTISIDFRSYTDSGLKIFLFFRIARIATCGRFRQFAIFE